MCFLPVVDSLLAKCWKRRKGYQLYHDQIETRNARMPATRYAATRALRRKKKYILLLDILSQIIAIVEDALYVEGRSSRSRRVLPLPMDAKRRLLLKPFPFFFPSTPSYVHVCRSPM